MALLHYHYYLYYYFVDKDDELEAHCWATLASLLQA